MNPEESCGGGLVGQVGCAVGDAIGGAAGVVTGSAIDAFVKSVAEDVENLLATVATTWMGVPSPTLANGTEPSGVVAAISSDLSFYTFVFGMIGVLIAVGKMGLTRRADAALPAVRMVVSLAIISSAGAAVVAAAIGAGDAFAPWIIQRATGQDFSHGVVTLMTTTMLLDVGRGVGLLVGLAALLGAIAQLIFMIFRGAMITLAMSILPTIAATSATQGGSAALRQALGWLLAFVLYKPVAAVVYAVGFLLVNGSAATGPGTAQNTIMQVLYGLTILILAGLTLPALVKFLVPVASAGVSSLFSGAAAGAAVLATGAAVVSMGATSAGAGASAARGAAARGPVANGPGTTPSASPRAPKAGGANPAAPTAPAPSTNGRSGTPPQGTSGAATGSTRQAAGSPPAGGAAPSGGSSAGGRGADRWRQAARAAETAARRTNDAAEEGGAGPTGATGR